MLLVPSTIQPISIISNPAAVRPYGKDFIVMDCDDLFYSAGTLDPIDVDQFADHVAKMHSNDDYLFSEEYSVSGGIEAW